MKFNHSKLRGKIKEVFGTQEAFADAMGISTTSLSAKLNGSVEFKLSEVVQAVKILQLEEKDIAVYFFTLEAQELEPIGSKG